MLSKLAVRNAKRSVKDYIIYLITVTLAFSFIFAFNLISDAKSIVELSSMMQNFKLAMYFVNAFIMLVICFLINYTTKFMFQKRSKEFGTYMLLGIQKKKIARMFTLESLILGFISLIISFGIGYVLNIIMTYIIMNIFDAPFSVDITFSWKAVLLSFLYFAIIYLIVLFFLRRRIKKMKIHDLLYYEKQNEKTSKLKKYRGLIFIVAIFLEIVAIDTFDREFRAVEVNPSFGTIMLCLILIIISIYGVIYSLGDFILSFVLNNKKIKYKGNNLFVARTFSSKVRSMSFTLGTLTVLITLTLICLNLSGLFKGMFEYQIDTYAPYDIVIADDEERFGEYIDLVDDEYTIKESISYNTYKNTNNAVKNVLDSELNGWRDFDQLIKLSDYNKLLEMRGMEAVTLDDNEYILHVSRGYEGFKNNRNLESITLDNGIELQQKMFTSYKYTTSWAYGGGYVVVVPDYAVENLDVVENHLVINTEEETTEKFAQKLVGFAEPDFCEEDEYGYMVCYSLSSITVRGQEVANNNGLMTICLFVCYYIAIIFTTIVGTILAIQSLSDATKYKYRYQVLNKLGVDKRKLNKTILKQLSIFFLFPVVYPIIVSFFAINSLNRVFKIALVSDTTYLSYFGISLGLFFGIYLIYFIATYFGYKKNISD